jgi:DNA-binding MarR family transcriptional regulator
MTQLKREITISKFENIYHQTLVNIFYTCHWSTQQIKNLLAPYGITPQQFNVLRILRSQYPSPSTINLIKSRIIDQMSDTSRIVDRLIYKGYLEKTANSYDRRAVDIIITEKGMLLLKKTDKEVDFAGLLSSSLTESEVQQLNLLLDKIKK